MLKELEGDVEEVKTMMCEQSKNINKERENLNRNQTEILQLKTPNEKFTGGI